MNLARYINQFVDIANHCQQLETIHFNSFLITEEMASHIMMQQALKQLIFKQCLIMEEVAQVFLQALKNSDHSFCEIKLFETKFYRCDYSWLSDRDNYEKAWKKRTSDEINLLTWSNQFKEDRDCFLRQTLGDASMEHKLDWIIGDCGVHWVRSLCCSNSEKLHYCAMIVAQRYDKSNISEGSPPNML